jgi:cell wall-associated NlpC family hydrolase
MYADYLSVATASEAQLGCGRVDASGSVLRMRATPGTGGTVLKNIPHNTTLKLEGLTDGWYKVTYGGKTGYVSSDYVVLVDAASASDAAVFAAASGSSIGSDIVAYAKNYLGCKYVYGANGPSTFDCSGFTKYVLAHFGYTINRTASTQLQNGTSVSYANLQPGDLVFFKNGTSKAASHVGIYVGSGKFIHASSTGRTVRIDSLSSGWYRSIYVGARRIG